MTGMRTIATALLLAACSAPDQPAQGSPTAPTQRVSAAPAPTPSPAADPDIGTRPQAGDLRTFRDWTVACDNVKRCAMASLGPEGGDFPEVTLEVARVAGAGGGYEIALYSQRDESPAPAALLIDGARFAFAGDGLAGEAAGRIAQAMAAARTLAVVDAQGARLATISLAGAAAALRYVDAEQGRAGTVTATVARGDAPATRVPAAPPVPVVRAVAPGGSAATPGAAQLAEMRRIQACDDDMVASQPDLFKPEAFALGGGKTLVLMPCGAGAYNVIQSLFVIDGARVAAATTDAPSGFAETGADHPRVASVVNGTFDGGLLTSYAKGRGLGDCGVVQSFAWDGRRFRLTEQRAMGDCRGNPNYLRTWHARVVRD